LRIVHTDGPAGIWHRFDSRCHDPAGTAAKRFIDELIPLIIRSLQRPKHVVRLYLPAIDDDSAQRKAAAFCNPASRQDSAAGRLCQIVQRVHFKSEISSR
jgi:hypothetical protein